MNSFSMPRTSIFSTHHRNLHKSPQVYNTEELIKSHRSIEAMEHSYKNMVDKIYEFDQHYKYRGYHALRWVGGVAFISAFGLYLFRKEIKQEIGSTGAEITSMTLSDQEVLRQANELARFVVYELLNDEQAFAYAAAFLKKILLDKESEKAFLSFAIEVGNSEEFRGMMADLAWDVMNREHVRLKAAELGNYAVHMAMDDPGVYAHSVRQASTVLSHPDVHQAAAEQFVKAMKSAMLPGFLRSSTNPTSSVSQQQNITEPSQLSPTSALEGEKVEENKSEMEQIREELQRIEARIEIGTSISTS